MKEKYIYDNAEYKYTARIADLKVTPSLSAQVKIFLSSLQDGNETQKRAYAAYVESEKENLFSFSDWCTLVNNRYPKGIQEGKKILSFYFMAQSLDKLLRKALFAGSCSDSTKTCILRYLRAHKFEKVQKDENK